jgi:hypothetical protein
MQVDGQQLKPSMRLEVLSDGIWHPAVIVSIAERNGELHYPTSGATEMYSADELRQAVQLNVIRLAAQPIAKVTAPPRTDTNVQVPFDVGASVPPIIQLPEEGLFWHRV